MLKQLLNMMASQQIQAGGSSNLTSNITEGFDPLLSPEDHSNIEYGYALAKESQYALEQAYLANQFQGYVYLGFGISYLLVGMKLFPLLNFSLMGFFIAMMASLTPKLNAITICVFSICSCFFQKSYRLQYGLTLIAIVISTVELIFPYFQLANSYVWIKFLVCGIVGLPSGIFGYQEPFRIYQDNDDYLNLICFLGTCLIFSSLTLLTSFNSLPPFAAFFSFVVGLFVIGFIGLCVQLLLGSREIQRECEKAIEQEEKEIQEKKRIQQQTCKCKCQCLGNKSARLTA